MEEKLGSILYELDYHKTFPMPLALSNHKAANQPSFYIQVFLFSIYSVTNTDIGKRIASKIKQFQSGLDIIS